MGRRTYSWEPFQGKINEEKLVEIYEKVVKIYEKVVEIYEKVVEIFNFSSSLLRGIPERKRLIIPTFVASNKKTVWERMNCP